MNTNEPPPEIKRPRMKPVIILPKGAMSKEDMAELRGNSFCVVEAEKPEDERFMEPPPHDYSVQEKAAIRLCRMIVNELRSDKVYYAGHLKERLCEILMNGEPLTSPERVRKV